MISDECYMYALEVHKKGLVNVYVDWEAKVRHIPCAWVPSRGWGPMEEDISESLMTTYNASVVHRTEMKMDQPWEDDGSEWEEMSSEGDGELLTAIEEMELEEDYYTEQSDEENFTEDEGWLDEIENGYLPSSPIQTPSKRRRI